MTTGAPTLHGLSAVLVPVAAEHVPELRRILSTPEVRARWRAEDASPRWPFDDASATRFTVMVGGAVRGMVQYGEEDDPDYRHASIDIFLDPAVHGRGVGRDVVATLAGHLVRARAHHRIVIDPAADNEQAIRCYAAVGFRPVGTMRHYERDADGDGWHDGLLMDLLAEDLAAPSRAAAGAGRRTLAGTPTDVDHAQDVLAAAESRAAALVGGDAGRLTDLLHEDFRWTTHVGETYDRAEYVLRNTGGQTTWRSQTLVHPDVVVVGDTAVLRAEVSDVVESSEGAPQTFRMPMTQVWIRTGTSWRCLAGHAGPSLP